MASLESRTILTCLGNLCTRMNITEVVTSLLSKQVITGVDFDKIMAQPSEHEKIRQLAILLIKKEPEVYNLFLEALRTTGHENLAEELETTRTRLSQEPQRGSWRASSTSNPSSTINASWVNPPSNQPSSAEPVSQTAQSYNAFFDDISNPPADPVHEFYIDGSQLSSFFFEAPPSSQQTPNGFVSAIRPIPLFSGTQMGSSTPFSASSSVRVATQPSSFTPYQPIPYFEVNAQPSFFNDGGRSPFMQPAASLSTGPSSFHNSHGFRPASNFTSRNNGHSPPFVQQNPGTFPSGVNYQAPPWMDQARSAWGTPGSLPGSSRTFMSGVHQSSGMPPSSFMAGGAQSSGMPTRTFISGRGPPGSGRPPLVNMSGRASSSAPMFTTGSPNAGYHRGAFGGHSNPPMARRLR